MYCEIQTQTPSRSGEETASRCIILIVVTSLSTGLLLQVSLRYEYGNCLKVFSAFLSHSQVSIRITTYYQKLVTSHGFFL